jgi:hypothetical protein
MHALHLAVEVAWIKAHAPHRFVDQPQFRDGEGFSAERGGQRGVFELCTRALNTISNDRGVVKGQRCPSTQDLVGWLPARASCVGACSPGAIAR